MKRLKPLRGWRRGDIVHIGGDFVALLIMFAIGVYAHFDHRQISHQQVTLNAQAGVLLRLASELRSDESRIGTQYTQLVEACNRLQIVRIEDNASHYGDWKAFRSVLPFLNGPPRTSVLEAIAVKSWVPRTNCTQAVSLHGAFYRPPRPVLFNQKLPPSSALTLYPTDFRG